MRLASQPTNGNTQQHCDVERLLTMKRKLFVLNGFGYAVDSLILLIQSIIAGQAALEFNPGYPNGLTIAAYVGMLVGALFWGIGADIIGRKTAFNVSLIICSIFAIVAGASPNWEVLGLFVCLSAFGAGGNLVLDTAVFLEYLPSRHQYALTLMAAWWGMLMTFTGDHKYTDNFQESVN
jgi:MFS family permease